MRGKEPPRPAPLAWLIGDEPESLASAAELAEGLTEPIVTVQVGAHNPGADADQPPLSHWPEPRPVLFLKSAEGCGFFHPLFGPKTGKMLLASWPAPLQWPDILPEDNFVRAGNFAGKRVWQKDEGPWMIPRGHEWKAGDGIEVACPADRPEDPALLLDKSGSAVAASLVCYQWLPRLPAPGTVLVLRYRVRAESGTGRLSVGPTMPLYIPKDDHGEQAEALRKRSKPHTYMPAKEGTQVREYRLEDWVQPTSEWQTVCVVWEWPPFCTEGGGRNVVIEYQGLGKVWLDNVEMSSWQRGSKR